MVKEQDLLAAARKGNVEIVTRAVRQVNKRTGHFARYVEYVQYSSHTVAGIGGYGGAFLRIARNDIRLIYLLNKL